MARSITGGRGLRARPPPPRPVLGLRPSLGPVLARSRSLRSRKFRGALRAALGRDGIAVVQKGHSLVLARFGFDIFE